MKMNALDKLAYVLVVLGGLNWGLIGFFKYSLVEKISSETVVRVIYDVIGVAAVYMIAQMVMMMSKGNKS